MFRNGTATGSCGGGESKGGVHVITKSSGDSHKYNLKLKMKDEAKVKMSGREHEERT